MLTVSIFYELVLYKKYFTNTELAKEQKLYAALTSSKTINEVKADGLINSV